MQKGLTFFEVPDAYYSVFAFLCVLCGLIFCLSPRPLRLHTTNANADPNAVRVVANARVAVHWIWQPGPDW